MTTMADITVKKNDTTTDITFSAVSASAGDKTPAVWRSTTAGPAPAFQPTLKMSSADNGNKTGRRVTVEMSYPYAVEDADSIFRVQDKIPITVSLLLPNGVPTTVTDEAVSQFTNLFKSALILASNKSGYAPV